MSESFTPVCPRPDWLAAPLIFVGHWEPLIFRRRRGGQAVDEAERYAREHSAAALQALQAVGANLVITHFDKGFGLTAEAPDLAVTREWISRLREHGLRVGVYIRYDTLVPETMRQDHPEAADWVGRPSSGMPPVVLHQVFRHGACPNAEGHLAYIESLVELAITEFNVDLIHFDGFWLGHENWACHCERCTADFTRFVRERYPDPAAAVERFGHAHIENLRPPAYQPYDAPLEAFNPVKDPVVQEWIAYRSAKLAQIARRLRLFIHRLNPQVAMEINSLIPIGYNHHYYWGFDLPALAPYIDALWTEDDHWAGWREDGVLISRIREFKIGERLGSRVFSYQRGRTEAELRLSLVQAMAFQPQSIGMIGTPLVHEEPFFAVKQSALAWFHRHLDRFVDTRSRAEIAVLRSRATLAYHSTVPHRSVILTEQVLIQSGIPFDIIYDDDLNDLARWRVLILPDVECLSAAQVEGIHRFVEQGGGLLVTELTGLWDEYRRQRAQPALLPLLGDDIAYSPGDLWDPPRIGLHSSAGYTTNRVGNGRTAFIPTIRTRRQADYRGVLGEQPYRFGTEQWEMPLNSADFQAALRWVGAGLPIEGDLPEGVAVEVRTSARGVMVHLVDYRLRDTLPALTLRLRLPDRPAQFRVCQLNFEQDERISLSSQVTEEGLLLQTHPFHLYTILCIEPAGVERGSDDHS
jgi:hypothetical protein